MAITVFAGMEQLTDAIHNYITSSWFIYVSSLTYYKYNLTPFCKYIHPFRNNDCFFSLKENTITKSTILVPLITSQDFFAMLESLLDCRTITGLLFKNTYFLVSTLHFHSEHAYENINVSDKNRHKNHVNCMKKI